MAGLLRDVGALSVDFLSPVAPLHIRETLIARMRNPESKPMTSASKVRPWRPANAQDSAAAVAVAAMTRKTVRVKNCGW